MATPDLTTSLSSVKPTVVFTRRKYDPAVEGPGDFYFNVRAEVKSIWRGTDSRRMDECVFEATAIDDDILYAGFDPGRYSFDLVDDNWAGTQVTVKWKTNERADPLPIFHWGWIEKMQQKVGPRGPSVLFTSRVSDYRFGDPLLYAEYAMLDRDEWDIVKELDPDTFKRDGRFVRVFEDLVFNPRIEGVRRPNMWKKTKLNNHYGFFDPFQIPDAAYKDDDHPIWELVDFWTLPDIVEYLQWTLNPSQRWINNTPEEELENFRNFPGHHPDISHLTIPVNTRLPEALDRVLNLYNWRWRLNLIHILDELRDKPTILMDKIDYYEELPVTPPGEPPPIFPPTYLYAPRYELRRQGAAFTSTPDRPDIRPALDLKRSEVWSWDISVDLTNRSFNQPTVLGDFFYVEATFPLMPAWDQKWDSLTSTQLETLRADDDALRENPDLVRVWRDWVANESGEYSELRDADKGRVDPPDLEALFQDNFALSLNPERILKYKARRFTYPRKRELLPSISRREDYGPAGSSHGFIFVEYRTVALYDPDDYTTDHELAWRPISELAGGTHVQRLNREMGVRFPTKSKGVVELMTHASDMSLVELRVTATIRSDIPMVFDLPLFPDGPYIDRNTRILFLKDRYRNRLVDESSSLRKNIDDDKYFADESDQFLEIAEYSESVEVLGMRNAIGGNVVLNGIYRLTDFLNHQIEGFEEGEASYSMRFNGYRDSISATQGAVCVGVLYNPQQQSTTLFLESPQSSIPARPGL